MLYAMTCWWILLATLNRGGVEDTRLEAKAKDTKKIRGQGQGQPFRGQTLSRPRTGMLEAKAKDTSASALQKKKRKGLHKNVLSDLQKKKKKKKSDLRKKKKVLTKIFQAISKKKRSSQKFSISTKKRFPKKFSSASQNFNNSKNSAVLEPRTGQFSRTWGLEAKDVLEDSTTDTKLTLSIWKEKCKRCTNTIGLLHTGWVCG